MPRYQSDVTVFLEKLKAAKPNLEQDQTEKLVQFMLEQQKNKRKPSKRGTNPGSSGVGGSGGREKK